MSTSFGGLILLLEVSLLAAAAIPRNTSPEVGCVDENGSAVDWWFLLKQPRWGDKGHADCIGNCDGDRYVYVTSKSRSSWRVGGVSVSNGQDSLLGRALTSVYDGSIPNYVFYNDQTPDGKYSTTFGHSKGFFAYDSESAVWVQHSIPHFPNYKKDGYKYGSGQMWYGQHAFCMGLTRSALNQIAGVMRYAFPWVYDFALEDTSLPNVSAVVTKSKLEGTTAVTVQTGWGELQLFGKGSAAGFDMLNDVISPELRTSLASQSWLNSGGPLGGYCPSSGVDVFDIMSISLPVTSSGVPADHLTYEDHAKWAISKTSSSDWFCALDNNHVESQERRAGLAVCIRQPVLSGVLRGSVQQTGDCGTPKTGCCYYDDSHCYKGQTCCSKSGESYTSEKTCNVYGSKHGCVWQDEKSVCMIPMS